jgi:hypothetical protein
MTSDGGDWREVSGGSLGEQAARVAGALAEAGIQHVTVDARELGARETDLPSVLSTMRRELTGGGVRVRLRDGKLWWTAEGSAAEAVRL